MASNMATSASAQVAASASVSDERSSNRLYWIAVLMTIVGIGIGLYLSYVKLADKEAVCVESSTFDCHSVQTSAYSEILGIPVAIIGLLAYSTMFGLLLLEKQIMLAEAYGRMLLFAMTLFGLVYSAYLTYIEGFVLEKWCMWCVASALLMVGLFVVSLVRVLESFNDNEVFEDDEELVDAA